MKEPSVILAVLITAASLSYAQTTDRKPPPPAATSSADAGVEQALTKIENEVLAAVLKRDAAAFDRHFADEAMLTTPDGTLQAKAQLLADLKSGDLVIESSTISDMKVQVYGDAAVVTYITTDKGKYKKTDISGRYRWTDVFVRRAGAWKIVAGQGTPIAPPPK